MLRNRWIGFVLLTAGATVGVWLGVEGTRAYQQRQRVSEIWELGGYVHRMREMSDPAAFSFSWPSAILGEDFLNPVVVVSLAATRAGDANLVRLARLNKLCVLDLRETAVTDLGLQKLAGLADLKMLRLTGAAVSDAGLVPLKSLGQLEILFLDQTLITDAGLQSLAKLPKLRRLDLSETQIGDGGLTALCDCATLEVVVVHGCDVSRAATEELQQAVSNLRVFDETTRRPSLEGVN